MSELADQIEEIIDRAQAFGGKESLSSSNVADLIVAHIESTRPPATRWFAAAEVNPDGRPTLISGPSIGFERAAETAEWHRLDRRRFVGVDVETCVVYRDIPRWTRWIPDATREGD